MQNPLVIAWGDLLSNYRWSWFVTFTFRDETKSLTGVRKFNAFIRALEGATGRSIPYFRADQLGNINGRFHFHALIANVDDLRRLTWMDWWNKFNGFAQIEPFDSTKGAPWYCARYLVRPNAEYDLGGNWSLVQMSQQLLPMEGLRVEIDTRGPVDSSQRLARLETVAIQAKKRRESRVGKRRQGALSDFKMPSTAECEPNPIIAYFNQETRRRRR